MCEREKKRQRERDTHTNTQKRQTFEYRRKLAARPSPSCSATRRTVPAFMRASVRACERGIECVRCVCEMVRYARAVAVEMGRGQSESRARVEGRRREKGRESKRES